MPDAERRVRLRRLATARLEGAAVAHISRHSAQSETGWLPTIAMTPATATAAPSPRPLARPSRARFGTWATSTGSPDDPQDRRPTSTARPRQRRRSRRSYKGRLPELDGDGLAAMLERYEALEETARPRLLATPSCCSPPTATTRRSAASSRRVQERVNAIATHLLFFTLELNRLEDAPLAASASRPRRRSPASGPGCDEVRAFRPHQLADEIERLLHEKYVTGRAPGSACSTRPWRPALPARRQGPDQRRDLRPAVRRRTGAVRERAATSIGGRAGARTSGCSRGSPTRSPRTRQIEDGWRHFARPISSRNLANQVEDEVVDALISAVRDGLSRASRTATTR